MVLQNTVILQPGIPTKLHFYDHHIEARTITDPVTRQPVIRNTLVFNVDSFNDKPVEAVYSTMAEKHAQQFSPYLTAKTYREKDFTITINGEGFRRSFTVMATPHNA